MEIVCLNQDRDRQFTTKGTEIPGGYRPVARTDWVPEAQRGLTPGNQSS